MDRKSALARLTAPRATTEKVTIASATHPPNHTVSFPKTAQVETRTVPRHRGALVSESCAYTEWVGNPERFIVFSAARCRGMTRRIQPQCLRLASVSSDSTKVVGWCWAAALVEDAVARGGWVG